MRQFARMPTLDVWYAKLEADELVRQLRTAAKGSDQRRRVRSRERDIAKAAARTNLQAAGRLSRLVDGRLQLVSQPPVVERLHDLLPDDQRHRLEDGLTDLVASYARSLAPERRMLLGRFRLADMARKVVGVGSVGTRCWILLSWAVTSATRWSCRPRRRNPRSWNASTRRASTGIRVSGSSSASG